MEQAEAMVEKGLVKAVCAISLACVPALRAGPLATAAVAQRTNALDDPDGLAGLHDLCRR